ncbi:MAG: hypothetical protein ACREEC_10040, partial [Thermoplasmata archaeon]
MNIEATSLGRARRFYGRFLAALGFTAVRPTGKFRPGYREGRMTIWITATHPPRLSRGTPHVPTDGIRDPISDHLGSHAPCSKRVYELEAVLRRTGFERVYS